MRQASPAHSNPLRSLQTLHSALSHEHVHLKTLQLELTEHLDTLIHRERQLDEVHWELDQQLKRKLDLADHEKKRKEALCSYIRAEISALRDEIAVKGEETHLLDSEYRMGMEKYETVIKAAKELIDCVRAVEQELEKDKQQAASISSMISDYQRLRAVLEDENRYLKQVKRAEDLSQSQRIAELNRIKDDLTSETNYKTRETNYVLIGAGTRALQGFLDKKFKKLAKILVVKTTQDQLISDCAEKSISLVSLRAQNRYQKVLRNFLWQWHRSIFDRSLIVNNTVEVALTQHYEVVSKVRAYTAITNQLQNRGIANLQQFEKFKFLHSIHVLCIRKDLTLTFARWRENTHAIKFSEHILTNLNNRIEHRIQNGAFQLWLDGARWLSRIAIASSLLNKYEDTKMFCWGLRRWRQQCWNCQGQFTGKFLERIAVRDKVNSFLKYQKRKSICITTLGLKMTRLSLGHIWRRYRQNVQKIKLVQMTESMKDQRQALNSQRRTWKLKIEQLNHKQSTRAALTVRNLIYERITREVFDRWRDTKAYLKHRDSLMLRICHRKEANNLITAFNSIRQHVQFCQKRDMHQILTDLNKKMEVINEKSTAMRNKLAQCTEKLGEQASLSLGQAIQKVERFQMRMFFSIEKKAKIWRLYRLKLLTRMVGLWDRCWKKDTVEKMKKNTTLTKRNQKCQRLADEFIVKQKVQFIKRMFNFIKDRAKKHVSGFHKLIHVENVMYYYRLSFALAKMRAKSEVVEIAIKDKQHDETIIKEKQLTVENKGIHEQRKTAEEQLKQIFVNFLKFQQRNRSIKIFVRANKEQCKKVFRRWRVTASKQNSIFLRMTSLEQLLRFKMSSFGWEKLETFCHEAQLEALRENLSIMNKDIKASEDKFKKLTADTQKRLDQERLNHQTIEGECQYYRSKETSRLKCQQNRFATQGSKRLMALSFRIWHYEHCCVKKITTTLEGLIKKKVYLEPYKLLEKYIQCDSLKWKSQEICQRLIKRRVERNQRALLDLWKASVFDIKKIQIALKQVESEEKQQLLKDECVEIRELYSNQHIRIGRKRLLCRIFMAFKSVYTQKKYNIRRISYFQAKCSETRLRNVMNNWKWLMFYKRTKRAYIKHKSNLSNKALLRETFSAMQFNIKRYQFLDSRFKKLFSNKKAVLDRFALDKIVNFAAHEKDLLRVARQRALHTLMKNKVRMIRLLKVRTLWKWRANLIERYHYLPTVMNNIQKRWMKSIFSRINEHKFTHPIYIMDIADKVTSQGYAEINSTTTGLMKEGFDPEEIKSYLKKRNDQDTKTIRKVVSHLRCWASRQDMVRAFHSWTQYIQIKRDLKTKLGKVFNLVGGLGKYWNRWRATDKQFEEILSRQSRGNMLVKYNQLSRLHKEYKRDLRDSQLYSEELARINQEYRENVSGGLQTAFSFLSNNVRKGMKNAMSLWRDSVHIMRLQQKDNRYEELVKGIEHINGQKQDSLMKIAVLKSVNSQLRYKCTQGSDCAKILEKLLSQKDVLSINLADKEHNLKMLLEDNLRLKQKLRAAQNNAQQLIRKVQQQDQQSDPI